VDDNPYKSPEHIEEPESSRLTLWFRDWWDDFKDSGLWWFVSEFYPIPILCAIITGVGWVLLGLTTGVWLPWEMALGFWLYASIGTTLFFIVALFFMFMGF
jgi:hypothetical protein